MRYRMTVKIELADAEQPTRTRGAFWEQYVRLTGLERPNENNEDYYRRHERQFRTTFPRLLEAKLNEHLGPIAITPRSITYHSIQIDLDIIGAFAAVGFTVDDLIGLVARYTPDAFCGASLYPGRDTPWLEVEVTGQAVAAEGAAISAGGVAGEPGSKSRLNLAWVISNTLSVVSLIGILVAAFFLFQAARDDKNLALQATINEQNKLTQAAIDDRAVLIHALTQERRGRVAARKAAQRVSSR